MLELNHRHRRQVESTLARHVPWREVWAFGSRARRDARPHSDLDLAIVGDEPLSDMTLARLLDDFTESDLPFKVDVVELCHASPTFRKVVERDHVVLRRP